MTTVSVVNLHLRLDLLTWVVGILLEENLRLARILEAPTAATDFCFDSHRGVD